MARRLALFFTRGVSLGTWAASGGLTRELELYHALAARLDEVALVTYGRADEERRYRAETDGLTVLPAGRGPHPLLAEAVLPLALRGELRRMTVLKTNQVVGGRAALRAKRLLGIPLVARAGYLRTEVAAAAFGRSSWQWRVAHDTERRLFRGADVAAVTTPRLRDHVVERYDVDAHRVHVVPNHVDVGRFRPTRAHAERRGVCYVGRLAPEKAVDLLVDAVAGLEVPLTIAGDGPLAPALRARAPNARFLGPIPNDELPAVLAEAAVFVLPSRFEGHPKALLEAMASGLAVVGTDVAGTREVVVDGETGVLVPREAEAMRAAIDGLLRDDERRERLGRAARAAVEAAYSLDAVLELELAVLAAAER